MGFGTSGRRNQRPRPAGSETPPYRRRASALPCRRNQARCHPQRLAARRGELCEGSRPAEPTGGRRGRCRGLFENRANGELRTDETLRRTAGRALQVIDPSRCGELRAAAQDDNSVPTLRELREQLEDHILSPFAARSACSRGREWPEELLPYSHGLPTRPLTASFIPSPFAAWPIRPRCSSRPRGIIIGRG